MNLSVFLVFMLMSTLLSLAYTCACPYALVKTRLYAMRHFRIERKLGRVHFRKDFWDCY